METIKEDYVSFEIAKLLKEKGFDEKCFALYNPDGILIQSGIKLSNIQVGRVKGSYSAPTLQMAIKWLREIYKIFIEIGVSIDLNGDYHYSYSILNRECKYVRKEYTDFDWNYKQACEVAIKYCLVNLI